MQIDYSIDMAVYQHTYATYPGALKTACTIISVQCARAPPSSAVPVPPAPLSTDPTLTVLQKKPSVCRPFRPGGRLLFPFVRPPLFLNSNISASNRARRVRFRSVRRTGVQEPNRKRRVMKTIDGDVMTAAPVFGIRAAQ